MNEVNVVFTGTDPQSCRGGIGFVMPGYFSALQAAGLAWTSIPSYHPTLRGGKWRLWLAAIPRLLRTIFALKRSGKIPVVYSHAGAGFSLVREGVLLLFARASGARTLVQLHAPEVDRYLRESWRRWLFRIAISGAERVCVLTPWWRRRFAKAGIERGVVVIANPLPSEIEAIASRPRVRPMEGTSTDRLTILALTRLAPRKGVDCVIEALSHLPDSTRLIIAGDGASRTALEEQVRARGLAQRISFTGWVSGDDKARLFQEADIFCLPSRNDSFGMVYIEAMAHGLPVVALRWGAIPDVVPDGKAGILVDRPSGQAVANAVARLQDAALREQMGAAGKKWVLQQFSSRIIGERLSATIRSLVVT